MRYRLAVLCLLSLCVPAFAQLRGEPCDARPADRDAIRAHIESIFQAFVDHDGVKLRATHAPEWRGFLENSQTGIRGIDRYMAAVDGATHPGPNGMKSYKITEFDCALYGDTAIVPFVADVHGEWDGQPWDSTLRIVDFYAKLNGAWIQAGSDTQVHPKELRRPVGLRTLSNGAKQQLMEVRERVWKAYFNNDRAVLEKVLPAELIAVDPGGNEWANRDAVLAGAQQFARSGGKLVKLDFPRTELQAYGNVVQVYSTYRLELDGPQGRRQQAGRATETFVEQNGQWLNVGWHLDSALPDNDAGPSKP